MANIKKFLPVFFSSLFLVASIFFVSTHAYSQNIMNVQAKNQIAKEDGIIFDQISNLTKNTQTELKPDADIVDQKKAEKEESKLPSEWILKADDYRNIGLNEEGFPIATEEQKKKLKKEEVKKITLNYGSDDFYFSSDYLLVPIEPDYHGTVINLPENEKNMIVHMLCHEFGGDYGGCLLVAQVMRDAMLYNSTMPHNEYGYVDVKTMLDTCFSPHYSSDYHDCSTVFAMGGTPDNSLAAYNYVFEQGKSAIQHKILCYASPDIEFQFNPNLYKVILYTTPNGLWNGLFWSWI